MHWQCAHQSQGKYMKIASKLFTHWEWGVRSLWSHIRLGFMSNACTEILATHGNRILCEQDIKTTITRSHVVWLEPGRGVYWMEFALTICSAWSGHKFTAHLICDFVSLSLSRQLAMATNWNNFIQSGITHLILKHTHTQTRILPAYIY